MEYDIDLTRKLLEDALNDNNIIISSFYDSLDSGEQVDRYLKTVQELINQANKTGATAWGVISQTNTGEIVNIRENYLTSFDWQLRIEVFKENKKEINTKLRNMINQLKGRSFKITDDDNKEYKIMVAFSNIQADIPNILNDEEVVTLFLNGTTTLSDSKFLLTNDIEEIYLSDDMNIEVRVYPLTNFSDYGVTGNDENTKDMKYRTQKRITGFGNTYNLMFYVDTTNPITMKLWEISKYGGIYADHQDNAMTPNEIYTLKEKINGYWYVTKLKLTGATPNATVGGLISVECTFQLQEFVSKTQA